MQMFAKGLRGQDRQLGNSGGGVSSIVKKCVETIYMEPYIYACVLGEGEKRTSNSQDAESLGVPKEPRGSSPEESAQGMSIELENGDGLVSDQGEYAVIESLPQVKERKVPEHLQCLLPMEGS